MMKLVSKRKGDTGDLFTFRGDGAGMVGAWDRNAALCGGQLGGSTVENGPTAVSPLLSLPLMMNPWSALFRRAAETKRTVIKDRLLAEIKANKKRKKSKAAGEGKKKSKVGSCA